MEVNKLLSDIYFDVKNPGSFGGANKLYVIAKKSVPNLKLSDVKQFLQGVNAYTLHKRVINKFKRNPILVQRINEQWEADLTEMNDYNISRKNQGYKYLLMVIDCFSKYLYVYPLKNKSQISVLNAFKKLFKVNKPEKLRTDKGLEFNNTSFKNYLKSNNVRYFTSNDSKIKCAIVERVNQTIKNKLMRIITHNQNKEYISKLPDVVATYNNTFHRTIKMKPNEVSMENSKKVFENIYGVKNFKELFFAKNSDFLKKAQLKKYDKVRIKYNLKPSIHKSHLPLWSDRVYSVDKINDKPINKNYKLNTEEEKIKQSFYPQEVQKIDPNVAYRIEKVLKKRQRKGEEELLVKFFGYPSTYNKWIRKDQVIHKT